MKKVSEEKSEEGRKERDEVRKRKIKDKMMEIIDLNREEGREKKEGEEEKEKKERKVVIVNGKSWKKISERGKKKKNGLEKKKLKVEKIK